MKLILLGILATAGAPSGTPPVGDSITVARLQYDGGGDWYANPSSLPNLLATVRERTGIPVARREANVTALDPALRDFPYLYMTGHGNVAFSAAERRGLRDYLVSGGFLHADDNYGLDESFRKEMQAIFPEAALTEIPADHPVFHTFYDFPEGLPKIHEHDGNPPQAFGIFHEGRLVVFYTYESDLGDGWEDESVHEDPASTREQALRMGVNLVLYVLGQAAS